jgi:hypothetical protein
LLDEIALLAESKFAMTEKKNNKDAKTRYVATNFACGFKKCQICSKEIKMYCNNSLFTEK